jgi:hypothetical protein
MQVTLTDPRQTMKKGYVSFEVKSLETIMRELHHTWVDVLKIDIEGAEWPVLKALLQSKRPLPFTQMQVIVGFCCDHVSAHHRQGACALSNATAAGGVPLLPPDQHHGPPGDAGRAAGPAIARHARVPRGAQLLVAQLCAGVHRVCVRPGVFFALL